MTVSTLLVCDDSSKTDKLQALIDSRPELKLTSAVDGPGAGDRIRLDSPSLVWIELAPEPARGLSLLGELREKYPAVQFLVSYDTLKADLVKSAMQLGAIEYIDPGSADRLLPDAIERIHQKLNEAVMGGARPKVVSAPSSLANSIVPDESYVPGAQKITSRSVGGVRGKTAQMEDGAPAWLLPSVGLIVFLVALIVYLSQSH